MLYYRIEMKRLLPTLFDTLQTLALALWLGGMVVIGAVVAPAAFHIAGLTRMQSGMVVGESLRAFGNVIEICGLVMIGAQFLTRRRYQRSRPLFLGDGVRQLLTFGALLLAEYGKYSLFPMLDKARLANDMAGFDRLHHLYSSLAMVQVWLLVGIAGLTAWLQAPRAPASAPIAASANAEPPARPTSARTARKATK